MAESEPTVFIVDNDGPVREGRAEPGTRRQTGRRDVHDGSAVPGVGSDTVHDAVVVGIRAQITF
ncbi:MAG: hypothetical protein A2Y76_11090 [Planctomycetes bacterium RBG_13_60_9]|nr:MAG: hypothetical protein A2Y76_11090 [Planctomycetes bacterium RBG_13_60_9]